jgi:hypothetical protein
MPVRLAAAVLITAGLAAGSAFAAGALNAKNLVLQASDMPSGAKRVSFGSSKGAIKIPRTIKGQVAYVGYRFKSGGATEMVAAAAGVVKSTQDGHDVLVYMKKQLSRSGTFKNLSLPSYGDEQFSAGASTSGFSAGVVFVRKGTRLWEVVVSGFPSFSKTKMLSELKKYAAKEKARAGG